MELIPFLAFIVGGCGGCVGAPPAAFDSRYAVRIWTAVWVSRCARVTFEPDVEGYAALLRVTLGCAGSRVVALKLSLSQVVAGTGRTICILE